MHVLGVEAAVVGVASVATASAAHASTSQQAPATARIVIVPRGRDENSPARRSAIRPRFFATLTAGQARQSRCPRLSVARDGMMTGIARGYAELDWTALGLIAAEEAGAPVAQCAAP
jgi:hypothetical protein